MLVDDCLFNLCLFCPSIPDMDKSKPQYFVFVIYIPGICTIKLSRIASSIYYLSIYL